MPYDISRLFQSLDAHYNAPLALSFFSHLIWSRCKPPKVEGFWKDGCLISSSRPF